MQHTSLYTISIVLMMLCATASFSQKDDTTISKDSIIGNEKYGLRLGGDISKLIRSFIDDDYTGFEINGDYRLTKNLYIAGELGSEERTLTSDYLSSTAKGSYFKAGIDYNMYKNWLNMENLVYSGLRVGASTFSQTRHNYTIYNTNHYWNNPITVTDTQEYKGLSALWVELILGMKAEVLPNLFLGANVQFKVLMSDTKPNNFENLYIPGYNRTFDSGRYGIGLGYNISYLIPIYKKAKTVEVKTEKAKE